MCIQNTWKKNVSSLRILVIDGKESSGQSTTVCDDDIEPTQAYCMDMNGKD